MAHETVLVIEDEPAIRDLLRLHLGLAGFTIKEAADGRAGLTLGLPAQNTNIAYSPLSVQLGFRLAF
jgi:DNA-binding response OmpR family regulator